MNLTPPASRFYVYDPDCLASDDRNHLPEWTHWHYRCEDCGYELSWLRHGWTAHRPYLIREPVDLADFVHELST